jgi:nucleotide-binding universal stress UspA family protein
MKSFRRLRIITPVTTDQRPAEGLPPEPQPQEATYPTWREAGPILVVVDGQASGWDALEWGAAEAAARGCVLRILHVINCPVVWDSYGDVAVNYHDPLAHAAAEQILLEGLSRARNIAPDLRVGVSLKNAPAASAVLREGLENALIVLGKSHGRGSLSRRVVRKAACPVAVIELSSGASGGPSAGRVVVGVDRQVDPATAVDFAFRAALRRGSGVTAIHTHTPQDDVDGNLGLPKPLPASSSCCAFTQALEKSGQAYPGVSVRQHLVSAPIGSALIAEAFDSALLVVGSPMPKRHRRFRHSLAATVLRSVAGPVAIVCQP